MSEYDVGLRELKKRETRETLSSAALRLALERGPNSVRVKQIAAAAGVSPRTYNNYFSSREQAIVAAVVQGRTQRIANAVLRAGADSSLSEVVAAAVVQEYTDPGDDVREEVLMITSSPTLRRAYVEHTSEIEEALADALLERTGSTDRLASRVLAAFVGAAVKVALSEWLRSTSTAPPGGLVVPSGSLPDLLRTALEPLRVVLDDLPSQSHADPARVTRP